MYFFFWMYFSLFSRLFLDLREPLLASMIAGKKSKRLFLVNQRPKKGIKKTQREKRNKHSDHKSVTLLSHACMHIYRKFVILFSFLFKIMESLFPIVLAFRTCDKKRKISACFRASVVSACVPFLKTVNFIKFDFE